MHALSYEWRRLAGLRSTWVVLLAALVADAVVAVTTVRSTGFGSHRTSDLVRMLTAAPPALPLPFAAIAAGALGAYSSGHEVRYPVLVGSTTTPGRRFRLLGAKLTVVGTVSALLALLTPAVDGVMAAFLPPRHADLVVGVDVGRVVPALAGFAVLVAAAGWTGLLAAGLLRSAAAGLLVLIVPAALVPGAAFFLGRTRYAPETVRLRRFLPFHAGLGWIREARYDVPDLAGPHALLPLAATLVPALLLLAGYAVALVLRRRV